MRKFIISLVVGVFLTAGLPLGSASAAPYCGITWGSLPKSNSAGTPRHLLNARTGQHSCYDRIVFDLDGSAQGYDVRYVSNVYSDGEGQLITLQGGAKLQIVLHAASYDDFGSPTYPGMVNVNLPGINLSGYQTFRQAKFAGSFEGQTTIGLGVRAQLPFRVLKLDNRVIIDVAHQW